MKEDYLWDKSGKDAEIERLENALEAFRYKKGQPPALPENVIPFRRERKNLSRRFFSFAFAAAAVVAFAVALSVWTLLIQKENVVNGIALTIGPQQGNRLPDMPSVADETKDTTKKIKRKVVLVPPFEAKRNQSQARVHPASFKPQDKNGIKLTPEERYAYEQLMRALQITSSKLNIVKKKVQGEEEKEKPSSRS